MDNKQFTFRRYKDEDADVLYEEYVKYALENIQPYFWGPSVIPERSTFLEGIQDYSKKVYRAPLIADECDRLFGIYHVSFHNANHYHELMIHLWDNFHLMRPVLKQIIEEALHNGQCDHSILLELPGYDVELHQAADELGLKHVGSIPLFLCHGKELHDKHFYVITAREWFHENDI